MTPSTPRPRALPGGGLAVLLVGQAMASMDASIVTVAVPTIRADLGASDAAVQLVVAGYVLTMGVLVVTCARIGDLVGHRRAFLAGLAGFTAASLLCGLAPDAGALVAGRVLQACGGALMVPQVMSLIQLGHGGRSRERAIGLYSMVLALGVALGQVAGGLVVAADVAGLGWRPAFLVNVPVGLVLLALGPRLLPAGTRAADRRLDLPGALVLAVGMGAVLAALVFGREYGWGPWGWVCTGAGVLVLAVFVRHERRTARPLLDLDVLRPRGVKPGLAACFVVMGCYSAFLFTLTLHLQVGLGLSPLAAGIAFVPYAVGFGALSLGWTRLPERLRPVLPVLGPVAFAGALVALVPLTRDGWHPAASAVLAVAGCGHAAGYSPLIARVAALVGARHASAVSALNTTGSMLANTLGVAALGGVFLAAGDTRAGLTAVSVLTAGLLPATAACALRAVSGPAARRRERRNRRSKLSGAGS
ncbi:putative MFS family arabinose efflux permease [Nocardiopsis sp. Huas11]|uniref:MFS transporter n=1 Tax=Nocardiopsis sp. Huas11 TaxID=2183912 RepID=UPI000F1E3212|nr:MFS transporter [Nocardiopsis sp. Huas11]RKS05337.1 putative MFS family arabinose efflux permease [Nocardiopsis sp. Huas11]